MRESDLLNHIYGHNAALPDEVSIPPGDDMGAIRVANTEVLVTVDQVIDGVHVNRATTSAERIAHKAIVRNLSDVAAMAALPIGAVVAACLPKSMSETEANTLFDHLRTIAGRHGCPLIGGDISMADQPMVLTVTVLATTSGVPPVRRGGAKVGDRVFVTGSLGGAWDEQGGGPHLDAEPRINLARQLATTKSVGLHSMIDLSDGLAGDLPRICAASNVAAEVNVDTIPCRATIADDGQPAWRHAMQDGEDYELCFTADGDVPTRIADVPVTRIGTVIASAADGGSLERLWLIHPDGHREPVAGGGWEHGVTQSDATSNADTD